MSEHPEFIDEMLMMNNNIRQMKTHLAEHYQNLEETENKIKQLEAVVMDIITEETENGKPKFSNADKRNAELKIRLSGDVLYEETKARLSELKKQISALNIELDHTIRKFDVYKILGQLKSK